MKTKYDSLIFEPEEKVEPAEEPKNTRNRVLEHYRQKRRAKNRASRKARAKNRPIH